MPANLKDLIFLINRAFPQTEKPAILRRNETNL